METELFQLLLDLAKTGSFSATAKKFYRTQPAVSIAIKKLEAQLGIQLIKRGSREAAFTAEGEALKSQMIEILKSVADLKFRASSLSDKPIGRVDIATIPSVGLYELGGAIKVFIKKYKDIRLHLRYEEFKKIYHLVEAGGVDLGVAAFPKETNAIEVIPMDEDEMILITAPGGDLSYRYKIAIEELNGIPFVTFSEGLPTREAMDQIFRDAEIRVEIRFESENIETLKNAVEAGLGVAVVPLKSVEKDGQSGRLKLIKIKGRPLRRPIGIMKSKKRPLSKAAELFVKELLKK